MMNNYIEYKGYFTHVEYSVADQVLYGKIEGIRDLINFECQSADQVIPAFHEAVDDYLAFCEEVGQEPDKVYKGTFNVRIPPELHRAADLERRKRNISLNQLVVEAIQSFLDKTNRVTQHLTLVLPDSIVNGSHKWSDSSSKPERVNMNPCQVEVSYARS